MNGPLTSIYAIVTMNEPDNSLTFDSQPLPSSDEDSQYRYGSLTFTDTQAVDSDATIPTSQAVTSDVGPSPKQSTSYEASVQYISSSDEESQSIILKKRRTITLDPFCVTEDTPPYTSMRVVHYVFSCI
ncbi:uncharacterized protein [Haliotis cracherodii]|uniref:uncharacterized protein n=1 Tax=Haliotis cracherodii TaxID=6455 RepID=UPI0039EC30BA